MNNFSYDIERYVLNHQAYDKLLSNKDFYEMLTFVEFRRSNTAGALLVLCTLLTCHSAKLVSIR
jgi:hypothetical protein